MNALPPTSRSNPLPRPTLVSKAIQAVMTPSASAGSSVTRKPTGSTSSSVARSRSATPARPSTVVMFQVNEMMSRQ